MEPKMVLPASKKGSPMGTAEEPFKVLEDSTIVVTLILE